MRKTTAKQTITAPPPAPEPADPGRLISSHEASWYIQVNPSSINKWVKEGRLRAFRTPGGHRRVTVGDMVAFLRQHGMPVPQSLMDGAPPPRDVEDREAGVAKLAEVLRTDTATGNVNTKAMAYRLYARGVRA